MDQAFDQNIGIKAGPVKAVTKRGHLNAIRERDVNGAACTDKPCRHHMGNSRSMEHTCFTSSLIVHFIHHVSSPPLPMTDAPAVSGERGPEDPEQAGPVEIYSVWA
ncbi:hypothetical protein H845_3324 (plasmid) [Komagataeibacter xylinus E25]|nr:hypothetical protein H845_3324 [Komagataeibacter xylinus E25]